MPALPPYLQQEGTTTAVLPTQLPPPHLQMGIGDGLTSTKDSPGSAIGKYINHRE